MSERQTGRSTKQIKECPTDSFYVCPGWGSVSYHERLSLELNRPDICFSGHFREDMKGPRRHIEVDHAAVLKPEVVAYIQHHNARVKEALCK